MFRKLLYFIPLTLACFMSSAQTVEDAIRYSFTELTGTALNYSVGSSMSALGGDFSVSSTNPAGLANYRKSEISISGANQNLNSLRGFRGDPTSLEESTNNFHFSSAGIVFNRNILSSGLKVFNVGIGFNRIANFNRVFQFSGDTGGSITDRFRENAQGLVRDQMFPFEEQLAFDVGAIFDFDGDGNFESDFTYYPGALVPKRQTVTEEGSISDFSLTFAGNVSDKFYFGFGLGFPFARYESTKRYIEDDPEDAILFFEELEFDERLTTQGVGVNLKLGFTYLISPLFKAGAYVHTPTSFNLNDEFSNTLAYQFDEGSGPQRFSQDSPDGEFEYRFNTPWKFGGGLSYVFKGKGFLSADVEYLNYASNNFDLTIDGNSQGNQEVEDFINNDIENQLTSALKLRAGGELVLDKFRVRAGVHYNPTPIDSEDAILSYRGGLAYRSSSWFIDLAGGFNSRSGEYEPYLTANSARQIVNFEDDRINLIGTFGFRF